MALEAVGSNPIAHPIVYSNQLEVSDSEHLPFLTFILQWNVCDIPVLSCFDI